MRVATHKERSTFRPDTVDLGQLDLLIVHSFGEQQLKLSRNIGALFEWLSESAGTL